MYVSRVDASTLAFSLSLHRHSYISILFSSLVLSLPDKQLLRDKRAEHRHSLYAKGT